MWTTYDVDVGRGASKCLFTEFCRKQEGRYVRTYVSRFSDYQSAHEPEFASPRGHRDIGADHDWQVAKPLQGPVWRKTSRVSSLSSFITSWFTTGMYLDRPVHTVCVSISVLT